MLWLFVGPTTVYLLDFFCSGIQFYLLLSPYLCFISYVYLDLYVLGDDALISQGSFMQTKPLTCSSRLWCLMVILSLSSLYPGSGVVLDLSIPDLCTLTYLL